LLRRNRLAIRYRDVGPAHNLLAPTSRISQVCDTAARAEHELIGDLIERASKILDQVGGYGRDVVRNRMRLGNVLTAFHETQPYAVAVKEDVQAGSNSRQCKSSTPAMLRRYSAMSFGKSRRDLLKA
jgi:hypothetical protein